jgi:hypothetical protein
MIKLKARRALHIKIPPSTQRAVRAHDDLLTPTGQLHRGELLLIVLLERLAEALDQARLVEGKRLDVYEQAGSMSEFDLWQTQGNSHRREA